MTKNSITWISNMQPKLWCVLFLLGSLNVSAVGDTPPNDQDYDGINDATEQTLIDQFRPRLYFDRGQSIWQMSIGQFVTNSSLDYLQNFAPPVNVGVYTNAELISNPRLVILASILDHQSNNRIYSSFASTSGSTRFNIDLNDTVRRGISGPDAIGTYAKVSVLEQPVLYPERANRPVGQRGDYFIQYWQLFGYNDSCSTIFYDGDHEGDWVYMDVFINPSSLAIRAIVHHHHGSSCAVSIQPDEFPIPSDQVPRAYLERNDNEWWPDPSVDDCTVGLPCAVHEVTRLIMRTENVRNVGERLRPMPHLESQLFVLFNGEWGQGGGPRSPMAQRWVDSMRSVLFVSDGSVLPCSTDPLSPWCIDRLPINSALTTAAQITGSNGSPIINSVTLNLAPMSHDIPNGSILATPMILAAPRGSATLR